MTSEESVPRMVILSLHVPCRLRERGEGREGEGENRKRRGNACSL